MTEIAAIGAVNAGIVQNEEQQFAKQQAQIKGEAEEFAQRRVEQSQAGANDAGDNPGAEDLDFSSDDQRPRSTIACAWRASRKMPFRNRYKKKIKLFRYLW